jgi:hypothetical protein
MQIYYATSNSGFLPIDNFYYYPINNATAKHALDQASLQNATSQKIDPWSQPVLKLE